jgi:nitroimidazol reductase NimA-like FMN-containing flavoprotein (pyridoxamine 5'-phosphate oxidase superfamily)
MSWKLVSERGRNGAPTDRLPRSPWSASLTCIKAQDEDSTVISPGFFEMRAQMDKTIKTKILEVLADNRIMTVATNRPDGWPQATTVGYVNDGLTLYFLCSPQSQKANNLARDSRISLTIDHDTSDPMTILGLSMAAQAQPVTDPTEVAKVLFMLPRKYPDYAAFPMPKPEETLFGRPDAPIGVRLG